MLCTQLCGHLLSIFKLIITAEFLPWRERKKKKKSGNVTTSVLLQSGRPRTVPSLPPIKPINHSTTQVERGL